MSLIRIPLILVASALYLSNVVVGQIKYEISFPNRQHHEAEISMIIQGLPDDPLQLRMSRTSPGRYSLHEFAKNVYDVRARDERGNELQISRPNPHQWDVYGHGGWVEVTYTLFADRADGTYAQIDPSHAHLNMPATFMFAREHKDWPIEVQFTLPEDAGWKVATQLFPSTQTNIFTAPDLHYFMDSPTELSNFDLRSWEIPAGPESDEAYTIQLAVHHLGTSEEVDAYAEMVKKVVNHQVAVFGEPPAFDTGNYTFIACYLPWASGDGMEHRNSTILTSSSSLKANSLGLLGTVSHEFFHAWNVERIRPASLEPFDFEEANMSPDLWFAEGFTSYYTPLIIRRAGLTTYQQYASAISNGLNTVINGTGRTFFNPTEMSLQAMFVDRASFVDPLNVPNTFISYYTWGAMIGLGLDLSLRSRGLHLDGFMRLMWSKYGKEEIPFAISGIVDVLSEYSGDEQFANAFFEKYIRGKEVPPYEELLSQAGLELKSKFPGKAFAGAAHFEETEQGLFLVSQSIKNTPWYNTGIEKGDLLMIFDGQPVKDIESLDEIIDEKKPGDNVRITYQQRGNVINTVMELIEDPAIEVTLIDGTLEADVLSFRRAWLGE